VLFSEKAKQSVRMEGKAKDLAGKVHEPPGNGRGGKVKGYFTFLQF
jgi:hypothetical protein